MSEFVNLHATTIYSPQRSLVQVDDLVNTSAQHGHQAVAIADYTNLYGATRFYKACNSKGIKPIIGATIRVTRDLSVKSRDSHSIVLLAKNEQGYKNLCAILTKADFKGFYYERRIDFDSLAEMSDGLICIVGIDGPIYSSLIDNDSRQLATYYYQLFEKIYGDDMYVGIWPHRNGFNDADRWIANTFKDRVVIYSDLRYMSPTHSQYYDMMTAIRFRRRYEPSTHDQNEYRHFLSMETMETYFHEHLDFAAAMDRMHRIVDQCSFEFDTGYKFPKTGIDEPDAYLKQQLNEGYAKITKGMSASRKSEYKERLRYEYDVIATHGFSEYFILVQDIVRWSRANGIYVGPGRGSIGGSLAAYALDIHALDPLQHELYFERFLNKDRVSMPDIDLDFEDAQRDRVIEYLVEKYGAEYTSGIGNLGLSKLKGSMKDVGKALGVDYETMNEYTKSVPFKVNGKMVEKFDDCIQDWKFKYAYDNDHQLQEIMRYVNVIQGTMRQTGVHAAGVVIAPEPLVNYAPMQIDKRTERVCTQYDMQAVEYIGLIKFDILGLTALTTIHNCIDAVRERHGTEVDLDSLSLDDEEAIKMLAKKRTSGIFQVESQGMTNMANDFSITTFEEIRDLVALYRPAVLDAGQHDIYKHNKFYPAKYKPFHALLSEILRDTKGILLFQETYMQVAVELAGFTLSEADNLRKAIGKKDMDLLKKIEKKWIDGCAANGVSRDDAEEIFKAFHAAGRYSFNKAHATGYGLLAYQTAFLKYHYPLEYMTALFESEKDNHDKFDAYLADAIALRLSMSQPDINDSQACFSSEWEANVIKYGLSAIKSVGWKSAQHIVEIRGNLPFSSLYDFMDRVDHSIINKTVLLALAKSGCFEDLDAPYVSRETIVDNIDTLIGFYRVQSQRMGILKPKPVLVESDRMNPFKARQWETELMGLSF